MATPYLGKLHAPPDRHYDPRDPVTMDIVNVVYFMDMVVVASTLGEHVSARSAGVHSEVKNANFFSSKGLIEG